MSRKNRFGFHSRTQTDVKNEFGGSRQRVKDEFAIRRKQFKSKRGEKRTIAGNKRIFA